MAAVVVGTAESVGLEVDGAGWSWVLMGKTEDDEADRSPWIFDPTETLPLSANMEAMAGGGRASMAAVAMEVCSEMPSTAGETSVDESGVRTSSLGEVGIGTGAVETPVRAGRTPPAWSDVEEDELEGMMRASGRSGELRERAGVQGISLEWPGGRGSVARWKREKDREKERI